MPHHIQGKLEDKDRYQTVYAKEKDLLRLQQRTNFTPELEKLVKGVELDCYPSCWLRYLRPVSVETIEEHDMHSEFYSVLEDTASQ